jgi:hypothetical protein
MNSTPAEFEVPLSAVSLAAETIGFVSQKNRLWFLSLLLWRFLRRTPGPSPLSSMNSTGAFDIERRLLALILQEEIGFVSREAPGLLLLLLWRLQKAHTWSASVLVDAGADLRHRAGSSPV